MSISRVRETGLLLLFIIIIMGGGSNYYYAEITRVQWMAQTVATKSRVVEYCLAVRIVLTYTLPSVTKES